ncbi:PREDICTED: adenylate isopentenyltransferase 8, chloroplastic-like [Camelina sativa]|uniref:Adenylate isopentenyltransferase 8, chloroplastic-like n=1 Tax=Camelina sativa TaxID=90675 RepID=A0ABM0T2D4_CAMSA|nr:PREDICTED: adenylate isopentenyltransferase 8, chloroplastic-like [Camelina sativa]
MQGLTSTFLSRSLVPTTSPSLRLRPRSAVPMTVVCMDKSRKEKVVVIMGATGSGKSRLSIDLATRFSGEIINSDKIQFYKGLEITTNQMSISERCGVPHHLLGVLPPDDGELTPSEYRSLASRSISEITARGKLPIIAGGSNSYIHALLVNRFNPLTHPFSSNTFISSDLRFECCFLWVDVSVPVLFEHLSKRVDQMMESGMFEELASFYNPIYAGSKNRTGVHKSIGIPEFDRYFSLYLPERNHKVSEWDQARKAAYEEAVQEIRENTWLLAKKQIERIKMLKSNGWEIQRLDATPSIGSSSREIWDKTVLDESVKIMKRFLVKEKAMVIG